MKVTFEISIEELLNYLTDVKKIEAALKMLKDMKKELSI